MPALAINTNLEENPDKDLSEFLRNEGHLSDIEKIIRCPDATEDGKPVIILKIVHPDGKTSYARTTQALYMGAASAIKGAQEREDYLAANDGKEPPACNMLLSMLQRPYPRTCAICKLGPCINVKPAGS